MVVVVGMFVRMIMTWREQHTPTPNPSPQGGGGRGHQRVGRRMDCACSAPFPSSATDLWSELRYPPRNGGG